MTEVVVTLSIDRKSGILAAAISTVARAGLQFQSHRFVNDEEGRELLLMAESESAIEDPAVLLEELEQVRGVSGVVDFEVAGRSLLHAPPEPEPEPEPAPEPESAPEPEPEQEPEVASQPEPESQAEEDESEQSASPGDAPKGEGRRSEPGGRVRRSMVRRRRLAR